MVLKNIIEFTDNILNKINLALHVRMFSLLSSHENSTKNLECAPEQ